MAQSSDKKIDMAGKMYKQNSPGGEGASPKYKQRGKAIDSAPHYKMNGKGEGKDPAVKDANTEGSFKGKYNLVSKKIAQKMIVGSSKPSQKGRASLNRASGKNEGEKMMLGKDEHNRA